MRADFAVDILMPSNTVVLDPFIMNARVTKANVYSVPICNKHIFLYFIFWLLFTFSDVGVLFLSQ